MAIDPAAAQGHPGVGHCPACGGPLERVHRHAMDRWISVFRSVHRYRCPSATCGWHGVLGSDATAAAALDWRRGVLWFAAGALTAVAMGEGTRAVLRWRAQPERIISAGSLPRPTGLALQSQMTPPGQDYAGAELPPTDARVVANPSPLRLRQSCAWGVPGANPYRGTVAQALAAARLPPEVARQIADKAERGWMVDQVEISRHGLRSVAGRVDFNPNIKAMAFGDTLCFDTRVNFPAGHVEYAALYEADDSRGRTYRVMVPYVCRNVSVLGERHEIDYPNGGIPSPASWTLLAAGLAALAWSRRRTLRTRGAQR